MVFRAVGQCFHHPAPRSGVWETKLWSVAQEEGVVKAWAQDLWGPQQRAFGQAQVLFVAIPAPSRLSKC